MTRLSPRDLDAFHKILPELYAYRQPQEFLEVSVRLLPTLVCADLYVWTGFEIAPQPKLVLLVESEHRATPAVVSLLEVSLPSHPYTGHWMGSPEPEAVLLSDVPKQVRLAHRSDWPDLYRLIDLNYQLSVPIAIHPNGVVALSLIKKTRDFTERDRLLVNLLHPHLARAYENARLLEASGARSPREARVGTGLSDLTARESEVAFWLGFGKTNAEIALILGVAARTIDKHMEHVLRKLHVENRTAAALEVAHGFRTDERMIQGGRRTDS